MRNLSIRLWVGFENLVARLERNESNLEHAANELIYEWPHLSHNLHTMVLAVVEGGGH